MSQDFDRAIDSIYDLFKVGEFDAGIALADSTIEQWPQQPMGYQIRGQCSYHSALEGGLSQEEQQKLYMSALIDYERSASIDVFNVLAIFYAGNAQTMLGLSEDSLISFNRALVTFERTDEWTDKVKFNILSAKGNVLTVLERWEEARECLELVAVEDPRHPTVHHTLAIVYHNLELTEMSMYQLGIHIMSNPKDALGYFTQGRFLYHNDEYEKALGCFLKAEEVTELSYHLGSELWFYMGNTFTRLGQEDEGAIYFKRACDEDPYDMNSLLNYANWLGRKGKVEESLECFQTVLTSGSKNTSVIAGAFLGASQAYKDLGDDEQGEICFKKAIELNPSIIKLLADAHEEGIDEDTVVWES